jgi:putative hydrolase of the HAD superfamily
MKKETEYIFFDCMETLIDLHKLPAAEDYAMWAYAGSGAEHLWKDFDSFFKCYAAAKQELASSLPPHTEYEIRGRFLKMLQTGVPGLNRPQIEEAADMIYRNYWRNYKAECYVKGDIIETLDKLSGSYRMGVVSNFMVMGGIEELLEMLGIRKFFDFVVTSVVAGKRKPHPDIYDEAVKISGTQPDRIVFIGDDFVNDYVTPISLGMEAIYYDKNGQHPEADFRIVDFTELSPKLCSQD